MIAEHPQTTADTLTPEAIGLYRTNGFVHVSGILSPDEAEQFRQAALAVAQRKKSLTPDRKVFTQLVNAWQDDETMKTLTRHPNVGAVAERLAGVPLRLWHDQILIKEPHNAVATEFHQDQPFWPHGNSTHPISAWIALVDVPVERGCMTFLPGSQARVDLPAQNLGDANSLFTLAPDFIWDQRITVPLKAGDCTFHHGRCAHMATPNFTDDPRVAHVIIFMDRDTTYSGARHVVTDPLNLKPGDRLDGEVVPGSAEWLKKPLVDFLACR